jgi:hypothetical protein
MERPGVAPEKRGALDGWEATPHQQLERLLRETGVQTGLLLTDGELRLIHAPHVEEPSPPATCSQSRAAWRLL